MRKISAKYRQWLFEELPNLENEEILSSESRKRIEDYYTSQTEVRSHWIILAFAVLGAILIGGGIILLFAHNWEALSRPARTALSFCPLLIGILVSLKAIRRGNTALCESASLFHSLAVGVCIALIGQTYHLPSNVPGFLLIWALLIAPLIFLLSSTGTYLFYLLLVCCWSSLAKDFYGHAAGFWLLFMPAGFYAFKLITKKRHAQETRLALWGAMCALTISLGVVLEHPSDSWIVAYSSFFGFSALLGLQLYPEELGWRNPLSTTGIIGITTLAYLFTWQDVWRESVVGSSLQARDNGWWIAYDRIITIGLFLSWLLAALKFFRRSSFLSIILYSFPLFAVAGFFSAAFYGQVLANSLFFNVYMLALGLSFLLHGCRYNLLRQVNYGMAVIGLLLITRFFDSGFDFFARGLAFIVIGSCFLAVNLFIMRRKERSLP